MRNLPETMMAARLHEIGKDMRIDIVPVPRPRAMDIVVRVRSCGIVPNLLNVISNYSVNLPHLPLPPMPAIFGLDAAGEIAAVGEQVHGLEPGTRVYINPGRSCGTCEDCRRGDPISCAHYAFQGYFGFGPGALQTFADYPSGGLAEYMIAPASAVVKLPDSMPFDTAARLGYLGTSYSALKKAAVGPGQTLLINGGTGTLGIGATLFALAMNAGRILLTGRNDELLARVRAFSPEKIDTYTLGEGKLPEWVRERNGGRGADVYLDCLSPEASHEHFLDGLKSLRRGGTAVNIGGIMGELPINVRWLMANGLKLIGSAWFTTAEGQQIADLVGSNAVDLTELKAKAYSLDEINIALSSLVIRDGGFTNFVIHP